MTGAFSRAFNDDTHNKTPDYSKARNLDELLAMVKREPYVLRLKSIDLYSVEAPGFSDFIELAMLHAGNLELTLDAGAAFGSGGNVSLSTEVDLDSRSGRLSFATGLGVFGGAMLQGNIINEGNLNGFNQSISFSVGAGPAASINILWGPRGFQFSTAFGLGFGLKADVVDIGVSKSF